MAGRLILVVVALPLVSSAWQTDAPPAAPCLTVGQMSGSGTVEHSLSLKSDSGHYSNLRYDDSTVFSDGTATMSAEDVNVDDRVCVQAFRDHIESVASRVLVVRRSQVDLRDRDDLLEWERESVFGTVRSLDISNRRIALRTPGGSDVVIDAAGPTAFWILPAQALDPANVVPGDWKELTAGDELYVRGDRAPGTGTIRARLIVAGGFRSFIGSIESMDPLTELLGLRDFRSGRRRSVHFDFTPIYIVGRASGSPDRRLLWANVGDLKRGDSVLVLARQDGGTGKIDALMLITGFSRDGIVRPPPGQSSDWIFKAVGFGGPGVP
jgi:hypothetical protein